MATTPPPPTRLRLRTPPTPLHGAKYDSYEPFSPRRSTRISGRNLFPSDGATTPVAARSTERQQKRYAGAAISPATSPLTSPKRKRGGANALFEGSEPDEERFSAVATAPRSRLQKNHLNPFASASTSIDPTTMLPTPSKTPHKKRVASPTTLKSTARVLFPSRPVAIEDAMPEPRSVRKNRKLKSSFTLNGLDAEDSDTSCGKIEIYTDVKEREPERDEGNDNPFLGPRKTRGKKKGPAKQDASVKEDEVDDETREMEEAVARDEGMIYVFRGKKVFRRFNSPSAEDAAAVPDSTTRRKIGDTAAKPFTRSSIKPRLLWPSKDDNEDPEEALTDIELEETVPVVKTAKKSGPISSPFNTWRRTKASSSATSSNKAKRPGSPMQDGDPKRIKS